MAESQPAALRPSVATRAPSIGSSTTTTISRMPLGRTRRRHPHRALKQSAATHAETIFGKAIETLVRVPVLSQAEADQTASGRFEGAQLDFIRGDGRVRGRTDVRAGRVLRLADLGARFSGEYYVTSAVHRYSRRDGYLTDFRVRRNAS